MGVKPGLKFFSPCRTNKRYKREEKKSHLWSAQLKLPSTKLTLPVWHGYQFLQIFPGRSELLKLFLLQYFHFEMGQWAIICDEGICFLKYNASRLTNEHCLFGAYFYCSGLFSHHLKHSLSERSCAQHNAKHPQQHDAIAHWHKRN